MLFRSGGVGPAMETTANAIMRTATKVINFIVSGIEYLVNTLLIGSINAAIAAITWGAFQNVFSYIEIPRFVPQYEKGTNYVPNDGLAYLHQGEAVVPKKYNQPLESGLTMEEKAYMQQMMTTMRSLDSKQKSRKYCWEKGLLYIRASFKCIIRTEFSKSK